MKKINVRVYRDKKKEWRWDMSVRNGKIVGASTESYKRRAGALKNLALVTFGAMIELKKVDAGTYLGVG